MPKFLPTLAFPFSQLFFFSSVFSRLLAYLLRGVAEEKENRIIEILLSSATPSELLTGQDPGTWRSRPSADCILARSNNCSGAAMPFPIKIEPMLLSPCSYLFPAWLPLLCQYDGRNRGSYQLSAGEPADCRNFHICSRNSSHIHAANPYKTGQSFSVFLSLFPFTSPVAMLARMGATAVPIYSDSCQHLHSVCFGSWSDLAFQPAFQDLSAHVREKTRK